MFCEFHNIIGNFIGKYYLNEERIYHEDEIGVLIILIDLFYIFFIITTFWFVIPIMWLNKKIRFKCKM